MRRLKRKVLNAERALFQKVKKSVLGLHYALGITRALPPVSGQIEITTV